MTLKDEQVIEILKSNPNKKLLADARTLSTGLRNLVFGESTDSLIQEMPYFEDKQIQELRKKCARSLKDVFARVLNEREKVFTAYGGSETFRLSDSQQKELLQKLANVSQGMNLRKWVQHNSLIAFDVDPMSLTFIEYNGEDVYPTYKSTSNIYDYDLNGRQPEYVAFELSNEDKKALGSFGIEIKEQEKAFRVFDDALERYVVQRENNYMILKSYPNYFAKVPGILNSNIPQFNSKSYTTSIRNLDELAKELLTDTSIKIIIKKYQCYPKEWGLISDCHKCEGSKLFDGETCGECKGSGVKLNIKIAERLQISPGTDNSSVPIPPGGYITPPIDAWNMMNEELNMMEAKMFDTFWGTNKMRQTAGTSTGTANPNIETATEIMYNNQPKINVLNYYREWAQEMCEFIANGIAFISFKKNQASTILFGDRYLLESPDEMLRKFMEAKTKNAPVAVLRAMYVEYLNNEYSDNPAELRKHVHLMDVEPYPFNDVGTVIGWPVSEDIRKRKLYFNEWISTMTNEQLSMMDKKALQESLNTYTTGLELKEEVGFKKSYN